MTLLKSAVCIQIENHGYLYDIFQRCVYPINLNSNVYPLIRTRVELDSYSIRKHACIIINALLQQQKVNTEFCIIIFALLSNTLVSDGSCTGNATRIPDPSLHTTEITDIQTYPRSCLIRAVFFLPQEQNLMLYILSLLLLLPTTFVNYPMKNYLL